MAFCVIKKSSNLAKFLICTTINCSIISTPLSCVAFVLVHLAFHMRPYSQLAIRALPRGYPPSFRSDSNSCLQDNNLLEKKFPSYPIMFSPFAVRKHWNVRTEKIVSLSSILLVSFSFFPLWDFHLKLPRHEIADQNRLNTSWASDIPQLDNLQHLLHDTSVWTWDSLWRAPTLHFWRTFPKIPWNERKFRPHRVHITVLY